MAGQTKRRVLLPRWGNYCSSATAVLLLGVFLLGSGSSKSGLAMPTSHALRRAGTRRLQATSPLNLYNCPLHTFPGRESHSASPQCICPGMSSFYCLGELCRMGSLLVQERTSQRRLLSIADGEDVPPDMSRRRLRQTTSGDEDALAADAPAELVFGFSAKCTDCDCVRVTAQQREVVRFRTWDRYHMYYHVHISKTGGTTFDHFLASLVNQHQSVSHKMVRCQTEKHPFTHPPFFIEPSSLSPSLCNVVSAEGRLGYLEQQFPNFSPDLIVLLRHPVLRTLSQFKHDYIYESNSKRQEFGGQLFTHGHDNLKDYYLDRDVQVHPRYGNWQANLLQHPDFSYPQDAEKFAFVGFTEYFRTTLCLFYFTFRIPKLLKDCQSRPIDAMNVACKSANTSHCLFHNERNVEVEAPRSIMQRKLASVDPELRTMIEERTSDDLALYEYSLDLFWKRVAVMEEVTKERFTDLPASYRKRLSQAPYEMVFSIDG